MLILKTQILVVRGKGSVIIKYFNSKWGNYSRLVLNHAIDFITVNKQSEL